MSVWDKVTDFDQYSKQLVNTQHMLGKEGSLVYINYDRQCHFFINNNKKKSTSVRYEISLSYAQPASNELSLVAYKHGLQNVYIYITKYKRKKLIWKTVLIYC